LGRCLLWASLPRPDAICRCGAFFLSGTLAILNLMMGLYAQWLDSWERKLATRDTNRVVRPFEWGTEWLERIGFPAFPGDRGGTNGSATAGERPEIADRHHLPAYIAAFAADAIRNSDRFFSYEPVPRYELRDGRLTFPSASPSGCTENDTVQALWFPARRDRGRVLVVLPQWNHDEGAHVGLAQLLNRFGISALRMTMSYHAGRKPPETARADYAVSSNIGRTIHASRQSVVDARCCIDWLASQGYERIGILGTSLGSCIAFITAAHDTRIRVGVFNHVSMYFSDVVWTGLSTQFVRRSFADQVSQDELRRFWSPISPASYLDRLKGREMRSLLIWARHDTSFLPVYSKQVLDSFRKLDLPHQVYCLPCGHYTTGRFPFKFMDGLAMCRFAGRVL